ncbi:MAG: nucleoside triphosphate pyrophosphohydrolase [Treponema sp.]|jgi:tetrapyrrole methylase family protein/MazG family protein|nr:nucleoside triphosphate pyrophosphohydrolase [Treponema sp.]
MTPPETRPPVSPAEAFEHLYGVIRKLRAPEGCPWDREQTPLSLRGGLIEETYECVEAIDEKDPSHVKEELGDIFLLAVMISYMYEEEGEFSVAGALEGISEKLIRRHPHVFAGLSVKDSAEVLDNWAKIKVEQEGRKPKDSILDEVSRGLPPLDRAWKLQKKAAKAGFDWPDIKGVVSKITEELRELEDAVASADAIANIAADSGAAGTHAGAVEEELGDLLFSVVNLCRYLHVEPSVALQRTNIKFTERFKYVEKRMKESGAGMKQENLGLMDKYWNEAKKAEPGSQVLPHSSC